MNKLVALGLGTGLVGLVLVGGWQLVQRASVSRMVPPAIPLAPPDSVRSVVAGIVSAGEQQPLLAHTRGYVKYIFFTEGDYAHSGQILVKLDNHTFILAPHAGFLGPCQLTAGQYVTLTTPVTTLSERNYCVVPVANASLRQGGIRLGDSVTLWAAAQPLRRAAGLVSNPPLGMAADSLLEIRLASRAPFRIRQRVQVGALSRKLTATAPLLR